MIRAAETIQMTDTGRQRRDNEDSMYVRAPVFVVADGMGGAQAGEVASRLAVEAFEQGLPDSGSPEERLADRVREANRRIHELSHADLERHGMGTTLTAAYLDDSHLAIAHVGDSRAYLFRDGELQRLTQDHSLVGELVRKGKLTEEQAEEHPQRSIITRALGPEASVEVDTWTYPVKDGDILLLCSDGLTSMVPEDKIADVLESSSSLRDAATRLIGEANAAGGRDNITVVLTRLEDVGGDLGVDAPTMVGASAPEAPPVNEPEGVSAPDPSSEPETMHVQAVAAPPAPVTRLRPFRPARRPPSRETERPKRRFSRAMPALLATLIVLGLIGSGGYLASRQLYFIGTNSQGIVTIYRGFPYNLPGGVRLYETVYVSGVPAALVPADRRSAVFNNQLRSQTSAISLVRDLELGQVSK
jgi:serine/threonine protein phosphatase PrpC